MPFVKEAAAPVSQAEEFNLDPGNLLDHLVKVMSLKNDAALARLLDVQAPVISKVRNGHLGVGATLLLRMHEVSEISVKELRALMGDRRAKFRNPAGAGEKDA